MLQHHWEAFVKTVQRTPLIQDEAPGLIVLTSQWLDDKQRISEQEVKRI